MSAFALIGFSMCFMATAYAQGSESTGGVLFLSSYGCRRIAAANLAITNLWTQNSETIAECEALCCDEAFCKSGVFDQRWKTCTLYPLSGADDESLLAHTQNSQGNTLYYFDSCDCVYYDSEENQEYLDNLLKQG